MPQAWRSRRIAVVILLEFGGQLNLYTLAIGKAQKEIVTSSMPARTPEKRRLLATQVIGPHQHFQRSGDTVADMIDILFALDKHDRMVIIVAAQPDTITQKPVG